MTYTKDATSTDIRGAYSLTEIDISDTSHQNENIISITHSTNKKDTIQIMFNNHSQWLSIMQYCKERRQHVKESTS